MRSKVIFFCALIYGYKFVASNPLDKELGQQRAFQLNSWQINQNAGEQAHGENSMTDSVQQYPTGQEYKGRQHSDNYDFNNHPPSLHSLSASNNPVNIPTGTNKLKPISFGSRGDFYPIRSRHQPIREDNQFKPQNWQSHIEFENSAPSTIDNIPAIHERHLTVQKPYHNSGQPIQLPPINQQHYRTEILNPLPKDRHYHPHPQSERIRYVAHTGINSETHTVPAHYENYHEAHAHNTNMADTGNKANVDTSEFSKPANSKIFENNHRRPISKTLNAGSYIVPQESSNKNVHVVRIITGLNNLNNRYKQNPIMSSASNSRAIISRHNGQPLNTGFNNHEVDAYNAPVVPVDTISDDTRSIRYLLKPVINSWPNNFAPPNTYNMGPIIKTDCKEGDFTKFTNDEKQQTFNTMYDANKPNNFYDLPEVNPIQRIYHLPETNSTVEYVNHLNAVNDPDEIVVKNETLHPSSLHLNSNSASGSKQPISNILDSLADKTDDFVSPVTSNYNGDNKPFLNKKDANDDETSTIIPQSQPQQDITLSPLLESINADCNPSCGQLDNYNPSFGSLTSHGNNKDWHSESDNRYRPYNSNEDNSHFASPPELSTYTSSTGTHTPTTLTPDDVMLQEFLDSLPSDNHNSPQEAITWHNNTTPFSTLDTVISSDIVKSISLGPDNSLIQKYHDPSSTFLDSGYDESLLENSSTSIPSVTDSDRSDLLKESTTADQIVTISSIELMTDDVKDYSSPTTLDEITLGKDSIDATENLSILNEVSKSYDTTTSYPSNPEVLQYADNVDDVLSQIEIEGNNTKSGNEGTQNDEKLFATITRQNSSETDSITAPDNTSCRDCVHNDHTNSDELVSNKNFKLDLSNTMMIMNETTDKDYFNAMLSSDSNVNMFIFQMPCQNEALVEKTKETTIYPNGTCIEQLTETRWKYKDDPSPVTISMKKIYTGGKCY